MSIRRVKRIEQRVGELEVLLSRCVSLLGEIQGFLLESGEFAQAADLEAPAVEGEGERLAVDREPEGDGIGDEKAPWD